MNYEFKVGDKGPLRNNLGTYEILAIDHELDRPIVAKIRRDHKMKPYATTRLLDGREVHLEGSLDLMPPEEYVWVNWYRHPHVGLACTSFSTEKEAIKTWEGIRQDTLNEWALISLAVKTKVPQS